MTTQDDLRRRRRTVAATSVVGAGLLGISLSTKPGSRNFYLLTGAVAGVWTLGGLASGPLHLGRDVEKQRPVIAPIATGAATFGAFYGAARVARKVPVLDRAITSVLTYAHEGSGPLVLGTALLNGLAEEVFFRGAVYDAVGPRQQAARSTAAYMVATTATRNPALIAASGVMGAVFAAQRKQTGGIQAPILTHLTWSTLMLRFLPPLFEPEPEHRPEPRGHFDLRRKVPGLLSRT